MKFNDCFNKKSVIYILIISVLFEALIHFIPNNENIILNSQFLNLFFSSLQLICLILICSHFISSLFNFRINTENNYWIKDQLFGELKSPIFLSFFRILHALICMWLIVQIINEGYIDFKFFGNSDQNLFIITFFHYFWLLLLFFILLGTRRREIYLIHFILSCYFFFHIF